MQQFLSYSKKRKYLDLKYLKDNFAIVCDPACHQNTLLKQVTATWK